MMFNTWSTWMRKMYRLDRRSHRYLLEPISEMEHLKCAVVKRFLSFTEKLVNAPKEAVRNIYNVLGSDCRSTTGANKRRISLEYDADPVKRPSHSDIAVFMTTPEGEERRSGIVKELIQIRDGQISLIGWTDEEVHETLTYLCVS